MGGPVPVPGGTSPRGQIGGFPARAPGRPVASSSLLGVVSPQCPTPKPQPGAAWRPPGRVPRGLWPSGATHRSTCPWAQCQLTFEGVPRRAPALSARFRRLGFLSQVAGEAGVELGFLPTPARTGERRIPRLQPVLMPEVMATPADHDNLIVPHRQVGFLVALPGRRVVVPGNVMHGRYDLPAESSATPLADGGSSDDGIPPFSPSLRQVDAPLGPLLRRGHRRSFYQFTLREPGHSPVVQARVRNGPGAAARGRPGRWGRPGASCWTGTSEDALGHGARGLGATAPPGGRYRRSPDLPYWSQGWCCRRGGPH